MLNPDEREELLNNFKKKDIADFFASVRKDIRSDRDFILKAVKLDGYTLKYASEELRGNKEIVLESVKQNGDVLWYTSDELKGNRELVLEAVKQNGNALCYVSKALRGDREVVLEAVKQFGMALNYVSEELQGDKEIVLKAVKQNGEALEYASDELQGDREIVLEAVKNEGDALKYASDVLQGDREIVLKAVKQNGYYLWYASDELKGNREIVLEAVKNEGDALKFASVELRDSVNALNEHSIFDTYDKLLLLAIKVVSSVEDMSWMKEKEKESIQAILINKGFVISPDGESIYLSSSKSIKLTLSNPINFTFPNGEKYSTTKPNLDCLVGRKELLLKKEAPFFIINGSNVKDEKAVKGLPGELTPMILEYLTNEDLFNLGSACKEYAEFFTHSIITKTSYSLHNNDNLLKAYLASIQNGVELNVILKEPESKERGEVSYAMEAALDIDYMMGDCLMSIDEL